MSGYSGRELLPRSAVSAHGRWLALFVLLACILAACTDSLPWSIHIPANLRTHAVAGVVEEVTRLPDGRVTYELENGTTAEIPSQKEVLLGGEPLVGELLLAGADPDGRQWVAGVSLSTAIGRPEGCFDFPGQGRATDGWSETSGGFRLPKAADFHDLRDNADDLFSSDRGTFCLNEEGEVTSRDVT